MCSGGSYCFKSELTVCNQMKSNHRHRHKDDRFSNFNTAINNFWDRVVVNIVNRLWQLVSLTGGIKSWIGRGSTSNQCVRGRIMK